MREGLDLSRVKVITFDAGGTLLKPTPGVGEIYREILGKHGVVLDAQILNQRFRSVFKEMVAKRPRPVVSETTERAFWREVVRQSVTPECPEHLREAVFGELWQEFAEARRWVTFPEVKETLATLATQAKTKLAVLSNWDSRLHRVLEGLDLKKNFARVFISSEMRAEKPDVRVFRAVENTMEVQPEACLHIGDHYAHDYTAARAAGWQVILITPTPPGQEPVAHRVDSFAKLPTLFQADGSQSRL